MTKKEDRDEPIDGILESRFQGDLPAEVERRLRRRLADFRIRMQSRPVSVKPWWSIPRSRLWQRPVPYAAAPMVLVLIVLFSWLLLNDGRSTLAFADVLEQIRSFRPHSYTSVTQYNDRPSHSRRVMRLSLTRRREHWPDGRILIFDLSQKPIRTTVLYPDTKRAVEKTYTEDGPMRDPDTLGILLTMQDGTEEDLGVREVDGACCQGFPRPRRAQ